MEIVLPQLGLFFWTLVLFLIFFFLLTRFAWKPIIKGLKDREVSIEQSLLQAKQARDEMAKLQANNEVLLREAREERDSMIKEANMMRDRIIAEAKEQAAAAAEKEMEKAKQQIESEKMAALTEIKNTAGSLAVDIAEKLLRREFEDRNAQEKLAGELISELSTE